MVNYNTLTEILISIRNLDYYHHNYTIYWEISMNYLADIYNSIPITPYPSILNHTLCGFSIKRVKNSDILRLVGERLKENEIVRVELYDK